MIAVAPVSAAERAKLTPWQCDVLEAVRTQPSIKLAAHRLRRSREAVDMALLRIRERGINP